MISNFIACEYLKSDVKALKCCLNYYYAPLT